MRSEPTQWCGGGGGSETLAGLRQALTERGGGVMGGRRGKPERVSCPLRIPTIYRGEVGHGSPSPPPKVGGGGQAGRSALQSKWRPYPLGFPPPTCAWAL